MRILIGVRSNVDMISRHGKGCFWGTVGSELRTGREEEVDME